MIVDNVFQAETGKWYVLVDVDGVHYDLKFNDQPTEQDIADLLAIVIEGQNGSNQ